MTSEPIYLSVVRDMARREARAFVRSCDRCGAHTDQPCRAPSGKALSRWHVARRLP